MLVFALYLTSAAESRPLCFNFTGIMRGIDLDSDGSQGNGLENKTSLNKRNPTRPLHHTYTCASSYLISKQHHDCVAACSRGSVFDSECVIVISNDVKIDVSLSRSHHTWGTFDAYADVT